MGSDGKPQEVAIVVLCFLLKTLLTFQFDLFRSIVLSSRYLFSGETEDTFIADLSVGLATVRCQLSNIHLKILLN